VDGRNLIVKAAAAVWRASGRVGEPRGVRVHLRKRIPMQGGLGGGSSNAAAALVALDAFWRVGLDASQLMAMAKCLGADVPFFLCGGTALGLDRGDEIYPLEEIRPVSLVLVFPPFGVATPEAFRWFDEDQAVGGTGGPRAARVPALPEQRLASTWGALPIFNDLEAPVCRRHPEIGDLVRRLTREGATAAAMTGSGSTVFGIFSSPARAREVASRLGRAGWQAVITRTTARQKANPSSNLVWKRFSRID
jgi:4-diphosphocytidyl-2-C-methyl-D-erythritol kinase